MGCINYSYHDIKRKNDKYYKILIPCGICHNCKESKKAYYRFMIKEASKRYKYQTFITLTYNNNNVPIVYNIDEETKKYKELHKYTPEGEQEILINRAIKQDLLIMKMYETYEEKTATETTKKILDNFTREHGSVSVVDINQYLDKVKKSIKRSKKIKDKDFKYFLVSEYPNELDSKDRPHYHAIILYNEIGIIEKFSTKWDKGDLTLDRAKKEHRKLTRGEIMNGYKLTSGDLLNMFIHPESQKDDWKRIIKYVEDGKKELKINNAAIDYTTKYSLKANGQKFKEIREVYKKVEDKIERADLIKEIRLKHKERKKIALKVRKTNFKQDCFFKYSQNMIKDFIIENEDRFIEKPIIEYAGKNGLEERLLYREVLYRYINKLERENTDESRAKLEKLIKNYNILATQERIKHIEELKKKTGAIYDIYTDEDGYTEIIEYFTDKGTDYKEQAGKQQIITQEAKEELFGNKKNTFSGYKIDFEKYKKEQYELKNKNVNPT